MRRWGTRATLNVIRVSMNSCAGLLAELGSGPEAFRPLVLAREQLDQLELDAAQADGAHHGH
jgi:hypothetical protein